VRCVIRSYGPPDAPALRRCVAALQDFERTIEPRLQPGEAMADAYCRQIHARCDEHAGRVFVAELDGGVVGFVSVNARQPFTELDEPPGTYALVTNLVVLEPHRGHGIGRRLMERAEAFARDAGAAELRIGVLAANAAARTLYDARGYTPHLQIRSTRLG
jgi:GNAT superfamily N-acetyltransferase